MAEPVNRTTISKTSTGLLIGRKAISGYLSITRETFYELIKLGMPAAVINGRWYAHQNNLEQWFQVITRQQNRNIVDEPE